MMPTRSKQNDPGHVDERPSNPGSSARRLRTRLKELRTKAHLTQRDVADLTFWSPSKVIRIEAGAVKLTVTDCQAILNVYGAGKAEYDECLWLCQDARKPSPWAKYSEYVTAETLLLASLESSASVLSNFEPFLVPGLLQTDAYARFILKKLRGDKGEDRIGGIIEMRSERQSVVLHADRDPQMKFILDEAVIRRQVGGPDVMRRQLQRLLRLMENEIVDLRIVPFSTGMYRSLRVPYTVLEFPDPQDEDVLYLEHAERERIIRAADVRQEELEPTAPSTYLEIFAELETITSVDETRKILQSAVGTFSAAIDLRSASPQSNLVALEELDQGAASPES